MDKGRVCVPDSVVAAQRTSATKLYDRRRLAPRWLYWRLTAQSALWWLVARRIHTPVDTAYAKANDAVRSACQRLMGVDGSRPFAGKPRQQQEAYISTWNTLRAMAKLRTYEEWITHVEMDERMRQVREAAQA